MKKILVILFFPIFCFSQEFTKDDFFYTNEDGLVFSLDFFKDYFFSEKKVPESIKNYIAQAVNSHEKYIDSESVISIEILTSYRELLFLSELINHNIFEHSKKIYSLTIEKEFYTSYFFDVIKDLIENYIASNQPNLAKEILEEHIDFLSNSRNTTCGRGAGKYYDDLGTLYFNTYKELHQNKKALDYAFKYLLNNKNYSLEIVEILSKVYKKEILFAAFNELEKNFVYNKALSKSYFKYLDFKIDTNGLSGVYYYQGNPKTPFQQLQEITFYSQMVSYLEAN